MSRRKTVAPPAPAAYLTPYTVWELIDIMGREPPRTVVYQSRYDDLQMVNCNQRILARVSAFNKEGALREAMKAKSMK